MTKLLLVDDHAEIRQLIRLTVGKMFEVIEAEDGVRALESVRLHCPALVILDVMMSGEMDGYQVLEAIKRDPALSDTRVIMVTARGQAKDYDAGIARGADAYFIKPFSPLQLLAKVRELTS